MSAPGGAFVPLPGAFTTYVAAFCEAQVSRLGVFGIFPPSLATMHQLHPSQLRAALGPPSWSVQLVHDDQVYKVTVRSELRNASHVLVWTIREQDAGQGAFVRSLPLHLPPDVRPFINAGSIICGYSNHPLSDKEFSRLRPEELEYALIDDYRGQFHYCAHVRWKKHWAVHKSGWPAAGPQQAPANVMHQRRNNPETHIAILEYSHQEGKI